MMTLTDMHQLRQRWSPAGCDCMIVMPAEHWYCVYTALGRSTTLQTRTLLACVPQLNIWHSVWCSTGYGADWHRLCLLACAITRCVWQSALPTGFYTDAWMFMLTAHSPMIMQIVEASSTETQALPMAWHTSAQQLKWSWSQEYSQTSRLTSTKVVMSNRLLH